MKSRIMDVLKDRELELGPRPPQRGTYQHFAVTRDDEGIAWVLFDRAGKSANTLSGEVMDEFGEIVTALEKDLPKGVVLRSAKTSGFIAGADINEFVGASDAERSPDRDGPRQRHHEPLRRAAGADGRGGARLLPRRRHGSGARLQAPHRGSTVRASACPRCSSACTRVSAAPRACRS